MTHQAEGSQRTPVDQWKHDALALLEIAKVAQQALADAEAERDALREQLQSAKASIDNAVLGMNTASAEWAKVVDENGRLREQLAAMKASRDALREFVQSTNCTCWGEVKNVGWHGKQYANTCRRCKLLAAIAAAKP